MTRCKGELTQQAYRDWLAELARPEPTTEEAVLAYLEERARAAYEAQDWRLLPDTLDVAQAVDRARTHAHNVLVQLMRDGRVTRRKDRREWRWMPTSTTT